MIEIIGLKKQFGSLWAVNGLQLEARPGEIFGLLGPNGAGKSTTLGCISGLIEPTAGMVRLMGHDLAREGRQARKLLGVAPQELALYEELSATENLMFWGGACGMRGRTLRARIGEVLEMAGLQDRAKEPVSRFSGGMKRRLNLACAVLHHPQVLLLDEPTAGVDPQSRVRLLELARQEAARGACVLYTTHYMEEAESLCDRLAVMDHGQIIASGTLAELQLLAGQSDVLFLSGVFDPAKAREALSQIEGVEVVLAEPDALRLAMRQATLKLAAVFSALAASGSTVRETTLTQPSLESLFIKLTGRKLRE